LQLELDLTHTKLELPKVHGDFVPNKMATAVKSATPDKNLSVKPTLKTLQQDPTDQSKLKSLMESLREPVLLGSTEEEQDPAQQLVEPTASGGKHPMIIPNFISSHHLVLQEDKETVLGTSGDAHMY